MTEGTGGYIDAGTVRVGVLADLDKLPEDLRTKLAKLEREKKLPKIKLRIEPDATGLKTALRKMLRDEKIALKLRIEPDHVGLKTALREMVKDQKVALNLRIDPSHVGLQTSLNKLVKEHQIELNLKIDPSAVGLKAKLKALSRAQDLTIDARVDTDRDTGRGGATGPTRDDAQGARDYDAALRNLLRTTRELDQADRNLERALIGVNRAHRSSTNDTLAHRMAQLSAYDADSRRTAQIDKLRGALIRLREASRAEGRDPDDDANIRDMEARLDRAAARRRTATIDVEADTAAAEGQIDRAARDRTSTINVRTDNRNKNPFKFLSPETSAAEVRVLALAGAIATLVPLLAPVGAAAIGAFGAIAAGATAAAAGVGVLVLGFSGVGDAVGAMTDVQDEAAKTAKRHATNEERLAGATDSVRGAVEALRSARTNAAIGAEDASRRIRDAELGVRDAQADALRAQLDLTRARKEAKQAMEDLALQVRGGQLAQESANLAQIRAKEELDRVLADPKATQIQRREAQLAFDQAVLNVEEQTVRNRRLAEERKQADKVGVEGSERVQNAVRGVTQAQRGVADAERAVADARRDQARQAQAASASIASAQRGLASAQRALGKAMREDTTDTTGAVDKLRVAMGKLTPAGQQFAKFVHNELKPRFAELKAAAQGGLLPGVEEGLRNALPMFSRLEGFVGRLASTMGELFARAGEALNSPFWRKFFDYMDRTAGPIIEMMAETFGNFIKGFAGLLIAFEPITMQFGEMLGGWAEDFANWSASLANNQGFQDFVDYAMSALPRVMHFIGTFIQALWRIGAALAPLGDLVLQGLQIFVDVLNDTPVEVLTAIAAGLMAIVAALIIYNGVAALAAILSTGVGAAIAIIAVVVGALVGAFVYAWKNSEIFRDRVTDAVDTIKDVIDDVFSTVGDILGDFGIEAGSAGDMVIAAMEAIAEGVKFNAELIQRLWLTVLKPILEGDWSKVGDDTAYAAARVKDAEEDLAQATRDSKTAQDALNASRAEGAKELKELIAHQRELNLDLRGATLDVKSAKAERDTKGKALRTKAASGQTITPEERLDFDRAQLAYENAVAREQRIREQIAETAKKTKEAKDQALNGTKETRDAAIAAADDVKNKNTEVHNTYMAQKNVEKGANTSLWDGIKLGAKTAWESAKTAASGAVESIRTSLSSLGSSLDTATGGGFGTAMGAIREAFRSVKTAATDAWGTISGVVGRIIGSLSNALQPAFRAVASVASFVWGLIKLAFQLGNVALQVVIGLLRVAIFKLGKAFTDFYNDHVLPVWTKVKKVITDAWTKTIKPALESFADFIDKHVAPKIKAGADKISKIWEGLKEALKVPIKFFVEEVVNKGIIDTFNKTVANFPGVDPITPIKLPPELQPAKRARGGPVWGAGTETSDSIPALLSHNEHVLSAREVRGLGGHGAVEAIRAAARSGKATFAAGGGLSGSGPATYPTMVSWLKKHFPAARATTYQPSFGYHRSPPGGYAADIFTPDVLQAGPIAKKVFAGIKGTFKPYIQELIYSHMGSAQVWGGKDHRFTGAGLVNSHYNHIHWSMLANGFGKAGLGMVPGAADAADGSGIGALFKSKILGAVSGLVGKIPGGNTKFGKLLAAVPKKMIDGALAKIAGLVSSLPSTVGDVGRNVGRFLGSVGRGTLAGAQTGIGARISALLTNTAGGDSISAILAIAKQFNPAARVSSGRRNSNDFHGQGLAADLIGGGQAGMRRIAEGFLGLSGSLLELIHLSGGTRFAVKNGKVGNFYGSLFASSDPNSNHSNHVHVAATRKALGFDSGGDLPVGTSLVHNATGRPESVFTEQMLSSIISRLDGIARILLVQAETLRPAVAAMADLGAAFSASAAVRGGGFGTTSLAGLTRGSVPAAAAFTPGAGNTVNVYPRAQQSETEIARLVSRELAWMEVVAR